MTDYLALARQVFQEEMDRKNFEMPGNIIPEAWQYNFSGMLQEHMSDVTERVSLRHSEIRSRVREDAEADRGYLFSEIAMLTQEMLMEHAAKISSDRKAMFEKAYPDHAFSWKE